jgi:hypothetical protein
MAVGEVFRGQAVAKIAAAGGFERLPAVEALDQLCDRGPPVGRREHSVRQRYPWPVSGGGARDKVLPGPVGLLGTESIGIPGGRAVPHQQQPVPRGRGVRDRARVEGGLPHPPIQVAAVGVEPGAALGDRFSA